MVNKGVLVEFAVLSSILIILLTGFVLAEENNSGNETNCTINSDCRESWSCTNGTCTPETNCLPPAKEIACENKCGIVNTNCNNIKYACGSCQRGYECEDNLCVREDEDNETEGCEWQCGQWSGCVNGTSARTCTNINNCTSETPKLARICGETLKERFKEKQRIKFENRTGQECTEGCFCRGVVMTCKIDGEKEMTVFARSGNIIVIQFGGVNATTNVTLYKENDSVIGEFRGNKTHKIILPDKVRERIKEKTKAKLEEKYSITLDENGIYHVQTKKHSRLFFLFLVREKVNADVGSEDGQVVKIRNPWWGFLAKDKKEDLLGADCGTVTPGTNEECCKNKGYASWNQEEFKCE